MIEVTTKKKTYNFNNTLFKISFKFSSIWQKWLMTIQDDQDQILLLNKPLTNGVNILAQHDIPNFLPALYMRNLTQEDREANFNNVNDTMVLTDD